MDKDRIWIVFLLVATIVLGCLVAWAQHASCEENGGRIVWGYTSAGYAYYCDHGAHYND